MKKLRKFTDKDADSMEIFLKKLLRSNINKEAFL